jgi:hypothetical protein
MADALGNPLAFTLSGAEQADITQAPALLQAAPAALESSQSSRLRSGSLSRAPFDRKSVRSAQAISSSRYAL